MCSLEEAWGKDYQLKFKPVKSQSELHQAYSSIPDDIMHMGSRYTTKTLTPEQRPHPPQTIKTARQLPEPRILARGGNSPAGSQVNVQPAPTQSVNYLPLDTYAPPTDKTQYEMAFNEDENLKKFMGVDCSKKQFNNKQQAPSATTSDTTSTISNKQYAELTNKLNTLIDEVGRLRRSHEEDIKKRNINDIILYVVVGILVSVLLYSIFKQIGI